MGYNHFRYARRVDADTIGIYHEDMTKMLQIDKATADTTTVKGLTGALKPLVFVSTSNLDLDAFYNVRFMKAGMPVGWVQANPAGASIHLLETTTPGASVNHGAIYTKNDNELYFQTGAGVEKTVTTV